MPDVPQTYFPRKGTPLILYPVSMDAFEVIIWRIISISLLTWIFETFSRLIRSSPILIDDLLRPTFWLPKRKSEPVKETLYFADLTFLWKGLNARLQWLARVQRVFFSTDYVNYSWVDMVASLEFWLLSVEKKRGNKFTHWIDIVSTVLSRVNRYLRLLHPRHP